MDDPYNLERFVSAQGPMIEQVRRELRTGRKKSHWMWYIFPQIEGLGQSQTAREYSISSLKEAEAFLNHPILGPRLRECARLVANSPARSIEEIFNHPDDAKFRSSMTLFARATPDDQVFTDALEKYFGGEPDRLTLALIS